MNPQRKRSYRLEARSAMNEKQDTNGSIHNPELWVDQYGDYLYRFAISKINDQSTAEDLVQETFVAALRGRQHFQSRSAVKTWLTAILKHKIVDYYRKKNREQAVEDIESVDARINSFFESNGQWKIKPGKWSENPMKIYEQREFFDVLYLCLAELPKRLAQAFMLREMEGLSTEELCKTMEITSTNSWVMLYRARTYLRRCLELKWFQNEVTEIS